MNYEIDFEVTRNDEGKINGVKLSAKPHTESIDFCASFPHELFNGGADILFRGNKMVFGKTGKIDEFIVEIEPDIVEDLKNVINPKNTISLEQWTAWGGGFKLYVKEL